MSTAYVDEQAQLLELLGEEVLALARRQRSPEVDALVSAVADLIDEYSAAAGSLAADFYEQARIDAGIASDFAVPIADTPPDEQIDATVRWAMQHYLAGQPEEADLVNLEGATSRMVANVGRDTIVTASALDQDARGWTRVPEAGCCAFCALMAIRGPVYHSEGTALFTRGSEGREKYHNRCRCVVVPVFDEWQPSEQIREWSALYYAGPASLKAFRSAFDEKYRPSGD